MITVVTHRRTIGRGCVFATLALLCFLIGIALVPFLFWFGWFGLVGPVLFWTAALILLVLGSTRRTTYACADCAAPVTLPLPPSCPACGAPLET